jgi:hypothetical protein
MGTMGLSRGKRNDVQWPRLGQWLASGRRTDPGWPVQMDQRVHIDKYESVLNLAIEGCEEIKHVCAGRAAWLACGSAPAGVYLSGRCYR